MQHLCQDVFAASAVVEAESFPDAIVSSIHTLSGVFFRPDMLFIELPADEELHQALAHVIDEAHRERLPDALSQQANCEGNAPRENGSRVLSALRRMRRISKNGVQSACGLLHFFAGRFADWS